MGESDPDVFQGISWAQRAGLGTLGAVLDPADSSGRKNKYIDYLQRLALRHALGSRDFKRALDFGCGTGRFLGFLTQRANEVYALERTAEMLNVARRLTKIPEDRFVLWRDKVLPFEDGFFELILSVGVLCAVPGNDLERLTHELQRVCAPGGTSIFIEQVDNARRLTPERYLHLFDDAGYHAQRASAIRRGASRFLRLATRPWFPWLLMPALCRAETASLREARFRADTSGYWDYLFVLKKRAELKVLSAAPLDA